MLLLLRDLRAQLMETKLALVNAFDAEMVRSGTLLEQYETMVENLTENTIPELQSNIVVK